MNWIKTHFITLSKGDNSSTGIIVIAILIMVLKTAIGLQFPIGFERVIALFETFIY